MQSFSLFLMRFGLGLLLVIWGIAKVADAEHARAVSDRFYHGVFSFAEESLYMGLFTGKLMIFLMGTLEIVLGALIILGLLRKLTYPIMIVMTAVTLVMVSPSVIDPWGWFIPETNVLLFPSLIIFAGALILWSFRDLDRQSLGSMIGF